MLPLPVSPHGGGGWVGRVHVRLGADLVHLALSPVPERPHGGSVTNSSAAVGWIAVQLQHIYTHINTYIHT